MPTVSVITPVYNGERYLRPALDSLLAQTHQDWELIVVDDGSKDQTPLILADYTDPRIVKLRQANAGEAAARNAGLSRATGEFIGFLDADDAYLPNALADLVAFMQAQPHVDVAFADGYFCDEQDRRLMRLSEHRPGIYTGNILEPLILSASVITVPICTLTRRSAIERGPIRFDPQLVIGPDWDFWIQLARYARFGYLDKATCLYRIHQLNITRTSGLQKRLNDLAYGRMKILNADWFGSLSLTTREQFFFDFLTTVLIDQPNKQQAILEHVHTGELPAHYQALLWRQVSTQYFLKRTETDFAIKCLRRSAQLWPGNTKSNVALSALRLGGATAAYGVLRGWQTVINLSRRLHAIGRTTPKPVPVNLRPTLK